MMRLSTRGRYAARVMVVLASAPQGRITRKSEIAEEEGVSADYLEQILVRLRTADLVRSVRGRSGGFTLSRDANDITVAEVLEAAEGPLAVAPCGGSECRRASECVMRPVWRRVSDAIRSVLESTTIGELAAEASAAEMRQGQAYSI